AVSEVGQDRVVYTRYDDYWNDEYLERAPAVMENVGIPDDNARFNALVSGQVDVTSLLNPVADLDSVAEQNSLEIHRVTQTARNLDARVNISIPPLDDPNVRRALSMAVDRNALADVVGRTDCVPSVQPFGEGYPGYNPDLADSPASHFDPQAARQLLDDAGLG